MDADSVLAGRSEALARLQRFDEAKGRVAYSVEVVPHDIDLDALRVATHQALGRVGVALSERGDDVHMVLFVGSQPLRGGASPQQEAPLRVAMRIQHLVDPGADPVVGGTIVPADLGPQPPRATTVVDRPTRRSRTSDVTFQTANLLSD